MKTTITTALVIGVFLPLMAMAASASKATDAQVSEWQGGLKKNQDELKLSMEQQSGQEAFAGLTPEKAFEKGRAERNHRKALEKDIKAVTAKLSHACKQGNANACVK